MITGINHITLAVKDIDKSFAFYKEILALRPLVKWDQGAFIFKNNNSPDASLYFLDPDGHKLELHSRFCEQKLRK